MSRFIKNAMIVILAMIVVTSCRQDTLFTSEKGTEGPVLSAYKERMFSRATGTDEYFSKGTRYRIWVTKPKSTELEINNTEEGIVGTESFREGDNLSYIDLGAENNKQLRGGLDFYGFTDGTASEPIGNALRSAYPIELNSDGDYTDYRRGQLLSTENQTTSGILRIPFRHIMAQVKLEVMKEENITSELELVSVEFVGAASNYSGVTTKGTYNVYENTFVERESAVRTVSPKGKDTLEDGTLPINTTVAPINTVLVFPESGKGLPLYYLRVTFNDPKNFYGKGTSESEPQTQITIPIYDNREVTAAPLHFAQNTSYTLCITFLSDQARIVTLVPKVYEWLDGETDSTDEEDNGYQEQDLGQPVTFNGVMWSDRNLGASGAHPTRSIEDWYKSVGYFYQYGRNIPYFPNLLNADSTINLKTPLKDALITEGNAKGKNRLFPVVNFESWGQGLTAQNQSDKIAPTTGKNWVWKLGYYDADKSYHWGYSYGEGYKPEYLSKYDGGWEKNTNTPCPPGWRLPTVADFKGITPGSGYAGNITFRWFTGIGGTGNWLSEKGDEYGHSGSDSKEPDFATVYAKGNIETYTGVNQIGIDVGQPIYRGFFPCLYREEQNDPETGATSKYILSMMDEDGFHDWNRVRETAGELKKGDKNSYIYNWGVVYGIKHQGTASAYRIKWEVKLLSEDKDPMPEVDETTGLTHLVYEEPFRGVLVISRFQASATDDFLPDASGSYEDAVKKYDWEHPVEVMYLPVGGFADNWSQGRLGNIGTELWYAISDRSVLGDTYKNIFWFKFAGSEAASQTILISNKSRMNAAVQIRCVRDLTNK